MINSTRFARPIRQRSTVSQSWSRCAQCCKTVDWLKWRRPKRCVISKFAWGSMKRSWRTNCKMRFLWPIYWRINCTNRNCRNNFFFFITVLAFDFNLSLIIFLYIVEIAAGSSYFPLIRIFDLFQFAKICELKALFQKVTKPKFLSKNIFKSYSICIWQDLLTCGLFACTSLKINFKSCHMYVHIHDRNFFLGFIINNLYIAIETSTAYIKINLFISSLVFIISGF